MGRAAIEAALKRMHERAADATGAPGTPAAQHTGAPTSADAPSFADAIEAGLRDVDARVRAAEGLPHQALRGELDFHEVAAKLKQSQLSFDFAMQVRNKLVDAYREVMRMNV